MAELGSILLRRGTTAERLEFVPLKGEIIYDTELKQVFVGDGETYGGRSVFNDSIIITYNGSLKIGENVAVVVDEQGIARSLRLPGGEADVRPDPVPGAIRYNTTDRTIEFSDGSEWFFLNKTSVDKDILELYVSLDGHDDRRYGEQRGRSWGTAFRTLNAAMREAEGIVCKGDFIVASNTPGVGIACNKYIGGAIIGKAIKDKHTEGIELTEVKI